METKSIFEMDEFELQQATRPAEETIRKQAWDKGGYISYYDDSVCPGVNYVIREYRDHKELVRLKEAGDADVIKIL